jgi:MFS family permease
MTGRVAVTGSGGMLTSLRYPAYRWLWLSNLAGSAGRWSLVLVLSAQILALTHSSFWVGAALFATQGPVILLAPLSGWMADRFDRRMLNAASAALSAVATGLFAALSATGRLNLLLAMCLAVLYGVSFVLQMTLRSTLVPSLVAPGDLLNAVSLSQVGTQGAEFLGPALTTPFLVAGGPAVAWIVCTVLYVSAAILVLPIGPARAERGGLAQEGGMRQSFRYFLVRPLVLATICAVALHCSLTMSYQGMLPMFVSNDLNATSSVYGALLTSIGLGAVVGSLLLARFSATRYRPPIFIVSLLGSGLSLTTLAISSSGPVAMAMGFLTGATQAVFMSMALALIQSAVDNRYRGRATSVYQLITLTPMALIGWGMGGLADVVEPRPVMLVSGLAFVIAMSIFGLLSPPLRGLLGPGAWQGSATAMPPEAAG